MLEDTKWLSPLDFEACSLNTASSYENPRLLFVLFRSRSLNDEDAVFCFLFFEQLRHSFFFNLVSWNSLETLAPNPSDGHCLMPLRWNVKPTWLNHWDQAKLFLSLSYTAGSWNNITTFYRLEHICAFLLILLCLLSMY